MKRTWVVHVGQGIGHELHNAIDSSEWYGPYTREEAERLEDYLNDGLFRHDPGVEKRTATAMPLESLTPTALRRKYAKEVYDHLEGEGKKGG